MMEFYKNEKHTNDYDFSLGEKCYCLKLGWAGNGTPNAPLKRVDVLGIISSIKGLESHNNIHKYEFKWDGGFYYTDNLKRELIPSL